MKGARIPKPRGVADILPDMAGAWQVLDATFRLQFRRYGFGEVRTPIFEQTDLFLRGVGEDTDIVAKEMYSFSDRAGRSLTLRPEGTAGVARAYLEGGLSAAPQPVKMFYSSAPMFRYDRPAVDRYRQFHQTGAEIFSAAAPAADAEMIALAHALLAAAGLGEAEVRLNSVGCSACRPVYRQRLLDYYRPHIDGMCADCRSRYERNPLRLLDCKVPSDAALAEGAPTASDSLCADCAAHFSAVGNLLSAAAVPFRVDPGIVRGLDYYTRTVFEVVAGDAGALCGGGRYDGLVEALGGPPTPAVGFAIGIERLLAAMGRAGTGIPGSESLDLFIAFEQESRQSDAFRLAALLRREGLAVETDLMGRSLRAQLRHADRLGTRFVAVLPDNATHGLLTLRDMRTGAETDVRHEDLVAFVRTHGASPGTPR